MEQAILAVGAVLGLLYCVGTTAWMARGMPKEWPWPWGHRTSGTGARAGAPSTTELRPACRALPRPPSSASTSSRTDDPPRRGTLSAGSA
jgi:hypothetical protein